MNRRDFCKRSAGVTAGAMALGALPHHLFAGTERKRASDRVQLGPMKIELSRMAQGTGSYGYGGSSNQTRKLGLKGLADRA